ncbi:MAG: ABC transporter permease [Actinomycetota bacterium]
MSALVIAAADLRRLFRDRTSVFFIVAFPFLIILAIGSVFGAGFTPKLGVVSPGEGRLEAELVRGLARLPELEVRRFDRAADLVAALQRGDVEGGLVIPSGYDEEITSGGTARAEYLTGPSSGSQQVRLLVAGVLDQQAAVLRGARFGQASGAGSFEEAEDRARELAVLVPAVTVRSKPAGDFPSAGRFDAGASQQLVLFMFVTSLAASSQLIEARRLGVARRMLAAPTRARTIVLGVGLGRLAIALVQALVIVALSLVLFGVRWGDPFGAAALVGAFALVGTGAGMLLGSLLENPQQAGSLGVLFGLGLAALGGAMVPLEVFPPVMRRIAHLTPHAWALDGFARLMGRGGTAADVLPQIGVLLGFAAVLLGVATILFRRSVVGAGPSRSDSPPATR